MNNLKAIRFKGMNIAFYIANIIMLAACFMPYVNVDYNRLTLMEGTDGIFFLGLAVLIFVFIAFEMKKTSRILGLIECVLSIYELYYVFVFVSKEGNNAYLEFGYFVFLAGAVVLLIGVLEFIYTYVIKKIINSIKKYISKAPIRKEKKRALKEAKKQKKLEKKSK